MLQQKDRSGRSGPLIRFLMVLPFLFAVAGIVLIPIGIVKNAEYKKTEKIRVTFTEPVASVTEKTRTDYDNDTESYYEIKVPYEYNGKRYTHTFTQEKGLFSKVWKKGDLVTFTEEFSPDGQPMFNVGLLFLICGGVSLAVSLPWCIVFLPIKKKKTIPYDPICETGDKNTIVR